MPKSKLIFIPLLFCFTLSVLETAFGAPGSDETAEPECLIGHFRSLSCIQKKLSGELGLPRERIMFLEDKKDIGETYQLLLDDLPLDQVLFPDNKPLSVLIDRLADLWRGFAEERIPDPVIKHASKLSHILPVLVQSGQYLAKHPQWQASSYATDYTTESVYFNFNAHEGRTGTERPGYIAYPLPKEGWIPESYLPDLLTSELDLYTDMRDQLLWLWNKYPWHSKKVNLFPTSYFHLTMRSPHSIHIPLLTGGFSRAIEQALAKGTRSESEIKATSMALT